MRTALVLLACVVSGWASAAPRLLVAQFKEPEREGKDVNLLLDVYVAQAIDEIGQVEPVVWSITDSVFRKAIDDGTVPVDRDQPSEEHLAETAKALQADYLLVIRAIKAGDKVLPAAILYRGAGARKLWSYGTWNLKEYKPELMSDDKLNPNELRDLAALLTKQGMDVLVVKIGDLPDWDSTSLTIARSWAMMLERTAFKSLPKHPKVTSPDVHPGLQGNNGQGAEVPTVNREELEKTIAEYISQGRADLAVLVLRDSIDKTPFDLDLRRRLASLLMAIGKPVEAAQEAERAAAISSDSVDLWLLAARAWVLAGTPDKAEEAMHQALARGAEGPQTQCLLGEVYVLTGDFAKAVTAYTNSINVGPTPQAVMGRAIAYGLAGEPEKCKADLAALVDAKPEQHLNAYVTAVTLADQRLDVIARSLRDLPPAIRTQRNDPAVLSLANTLARQAESLSSLIDNILVPEKFKTSHSMRGLAHKLMLQAAQEILEFAKTGDEDIGDEGTLSLGEALKLLPQVRSKFRSEATQSASL